MNITIIAGARPNFMKIAPIIHEIIAQKKLGKPIEYRLVHTGQHYDKNLSDTFFKELNIPLPHVNLNVKSGSQAAQTGAIMIAFEGEIKKNPADLVLVVGDVTSTMACAIVAKKSGIKVAHVEAGIRSGDMQMPEEINRIVTDSITDYFFTTSILAGKNLLRLGIKQSQLFFVGNVMIDTLLQNINRLQKPSFWDRLSLSKNEYYILTLHRPSNVDGEHELKKLLKTIVKNCNGKPIIFPVHPRTQKILEGLTLNYPNLHFVPPQNYLSFIYLIKNTIAVLTDSGGITEEATVLNIPCITFRNSTERPETCTLGTNVLVGTDTQKINDCFLKLHSKKWKQAEIPELWDGKAAKRIVAQILNIYG